MEVGVSEEHHKCFSITAALTLMLWDVISISNVEDNYSCSVMWQYVYVIFFSLKSEI